MVHRPRFNHIQKKLPKPEPPVALEKTVPETKSEPAVQDTKPKPVRRTKKKVTMVNHRGEKFT